MKVFLVAITSLVLMACAGSHSQVGTDRVHAAIAAADKTFMADLKRGDAAAAAAAYTDDAIVMPPNELPREGKPAIEEWLAARMSLLQGSNLQLSITEVDVQGDTAIVRGTYVTHTAEPSVNALRDDQGKTLTIWKQQADGRWKLHRDIWNSNRPMATLLQTGEKEP